MIITESQLYSSEYSITNAYSLLESMYYIENKNDSPALIPVLENTQVGKLLIPLEELYEYKINNGYSNLVYALEDVCYVNNIDPSYVGFTINDYSLLENTYYPVLVEGLLENGVCVLCKPLNDNSNTSYCLDMALYEAITYDDFTCMNYLLESVSVNKSFIDYDNEEQDNNKKVKFSYSIKMLQNANQDASVKNQLIQQAQRNLQHQFGGEDSSHTSTATDIINQMIAKAVASESQSNEAPAASDTPPPTPPKEEEQKQKKKLDLTRNLAPGARGGRKAGETDEEYAARRKGVHDIRAKWEKGKAIDNYDDDNNYSVDKKGNLHREQTLKAIQNFTYEGMSWPRKKIAQMLRWAHKKAAEYNLKLKQQHGDGKEVAWYQKAIRYLTRFIEWATRKIHNMVSSDKYQIDDNYSGKYDEDKKKNEEQEAKEAKNDANTTATATTEKKESN